ncbi:4-hydroxy-tetrahydrodipicolinate synthase [Tamaricihabitans halophyticus]|uniref:4-hydroxy-tetrahydrodipicolinate synthase n=1 Tax=Tamaricihabitans halophyticus TaxID=1262583 RepID=A0A4R2PZK5_9PSEU|nr:dihydrodipicolinate synthase family protein [Tamaricihabitans halophyticus]TCP41620.1 4-hydroxy-tetrahydrodipicolinate synthase [Tamaricihabitans halophyticus]
MNGLPSGVWGVVATPFSGTGLDVDTASLARLVRHYADIGVTGLTVLGVFGEAAQLSMAERATVLRTVLDSVDLPLVVGASSLGTAPVIEEVHQARSLAGDRLAAVMVQANSASAEVLAAHLTAIREATGADLVVQDYPLVSGVSIAKEQLAAAVVPGVVAIKAEAPPTPVAVAALRASGVPVFGGLGGLWLLDELAAGAAGAMTGFSFPEALLSCTGAWHRGGYQPAREALLPYLPLVNFEQQAGIALAIRKECLRSRGLIAESWVRPPAVSLPESLRAQLATHLSALPGWLSE